MNKNTLTYTYTGILISMFSISAINLVFKEIYLEPLINLQMVSKELLILAMVGFLLFYIIPKENLTLASIGLHSNHWGKSILWAFCLVAVGFFLLLGCIEIAKFAGWKFGESTAFEKLSPLTVTLITIRAGIAEEVFMRGFLLERFTKIFGKKWIAFLLSTIPFGLMHYSQGYAGIMIATIIGGMFALFYFWKKDLKANIIAHFLIDFIPNIFMA